MRNYQKANQGPEDATKTIISIADDLTEEQRKERKELLEQAKSRNEALTDTDDFLWVVWGPAWKMELKKIQKKKN